MRIISDFRDYYDTVQSYGVDYTRVYERYSEDIDALTFSYDELNNFLKLTNQELSYNRKYVSSLTGIPPKPKTYDDIKALVREPVGTIIATPEINMLMAEYKQIKQEIGGTSNLSKRAEMIKTEILNFMRDQEKIDDDDSQDKFVLRGPDGEKLASYSRNKSGSYIFR